MVYADIMKLDNGKNKKKELMEEKHWARWPAMGE
jgi:hypothetical protein